MTVPEDACRIVTAGMEAFIEGCEQMGGMDVEWYRVLKQSTRTLRSSLGQAKLTRAVQARE